MLVVRTGKYAKIRDGYREGFNEAYLVLDNLNYTDVLDSVDAPCVYMDRNQWSAFKIPLNRINTVGKSRMYEANANHSNFEKYADILDSVIKLN